MIFSLTPGNFIRLLMKLTLIYHWLSEGTACCSELRKVTPLSCRCRLSAGLVQTLCHWYAVNQRFRSALCRSEGSGFTQVSISNLILARHKIPIAGKCSAVCVLWTMLLWPPGLSWRLLSPSHLRCADLSSWGVKHQRLVKAEALDVATYCQLPGRQRMGS